MKVKATALPSSSSPSLKPTLLCQVCQVFRKEEEAHDVQSRTRTRKWMVMRCQRTADGICNAITFNWCEPKEKLCDFLCKRREQDFLLTHSECMGSLQAYYVLVLLTKTWHTRSGSSLSIFAMQSISHWITTLNWNCDADNGIAARHIVLRFGHFSILFVLICVTCSIGAMQVNCEIYAIAIERLHFKVDQNHTISFFQRIQRLKMNNANCRFTLIDMSTCGHVPFPLLPGNCIYRSDLREQSWPFFLLSFSSLLVFFFLHFLSSHELIFLGFFFTCTADEKHSMLHFSTKDFLLRSKNFNFQSTH